MTPAEVAATADEAYARTRRFLRVTPLDPVTLPPSGGGGPVDVLLKAEHLQHTGSFKARGALALLSRLGARQRRDGVVAASSGNHGLGVAYGLSVLGGRGTVYVPHGASPTKVAAIRRLGAEVREVGDDGLEAELAARADAGASGRPYVSPYNDPDVVAGQAGVGLEVSGQLGRRRLDAVVVAVGGGGLVSGVAAVLRRRFPGVVVVGASPAADAAMAEALGVRPPEPVRPTLSDGTAGGLEDGSVTLGLCRELVDRWVLVDEAEIAAAVRDLLEVHHQVVEGASGVALAAARRLALSGTVAVVSCGANVSPGVLAGMLAAPQPPPSPGGAGALRPPPAPAG